MKILINLLKTQFTTNSSNLETIQTAPVQKIKKFEPKKIPLEQLPGIGRHTPKALAKYGIKTINQFAQFEEQEIIALLGKSGLKLLGTAKQYALN